MKIIFYRSGVQAPFSELSKNLDANKLLFSRDRKFDRTQVEERLSTPDRPDFYYFVPDTWKKNFLSLLREKFGHVQWEVLVEKPPLKQIGKNDLTRFYNEEMEVSAAGGEEKRLSTAISVASIILASAIVLFLFWQLLNLPTPEFLKETQEGIISQKAITALEQNNIEEAYLWIARTKNKEIEEAVKEVEKARIVDNQGASNSSPPTNVTTAVSPPQPDQASRKEEIKRRIESLKGGADNAINGWLLTTGTNNALDYARQILEVDTLNDESIEYAKNLRTCDILRGIFDKYRAPEMDWYRCDGMKRVYDFSKQNEAKLGCFREIENINSQMKQKYKCG
ncbi:MAG: hypothetical protein BWK78_00110 [Thiotrichaceae bacterium IS1]|nr:MAG: hypothetical protein BWK78_00110 [Thiotrichaceae bacterium IS1]